MLAVGIGPAPSAVAASAAPRAAVSSWTGQNPVPGVGGSSDSPSLAVCYNNPQYNAAYMIWKGAGSDQRLFFEKMDRFGSWGTQQVLPFGGTSTAPSLACGDDVLMAVWKGAGTDERISTPRAATEGRPGRLSRPWRASASPT
jgi:hypothetical protein